MVLPSTKRQEIALHTFARYIRSAVFGALGHFVDLVEEHDAVLLDIAQRVVLELFFVDELRRFFVAQQNQRVFDFDFAVAGAAAGQILEQALELIGHFFHAGRRHDLNAETGSGQFHFDFAIVQLAFAQAFAQLLARCRLFLVILLVVGLETKAAGAWQKRIQHPFLGGVFGAMPHFAHRRFAVHFDGHVDQVADNGFHVAADISDFGEFGRLDFDERRIRQARQTPRDFGFADAGGTDHENVLGGDFVAQAFIHLHAPPAVAQGNGHGAFGRVLADDVLVQFLDDFSGCHFRHKLFETLCHRCQERPPGAASSSSMVRL